MARSWILALMMLCSPAFAHDDAASACRALVMDYAYYRDRLDADNFAAIFSKNAVLSVQGNEFTGRDAIRQRLLDIEGNPVSRHLMSTIRITPIDAATAHGVSYVKVYVEEAPDNERPVVTSGFLAIGEYHDIFKLTDAGWKIARREFKPVLAPGRK